MEQRGARISSTYQDGKVAGLCTHRTINLPPKYVIFVLCHPPLWFEFHPIPRSFVFDTRRKQNFVWKLFPRDLFLYIFFNCIFFIFFKFHVFNIFFRLTFFLFLFISGFLYIFSNFTFFIHFFKFHVSYTFYFLCNLYFNSYYVISQFLHTNFYIFFK